MVHRFAVLAGDPCQLPPVLTAPAEVLQLGRNPGPGSGANACPGLGTAQHGLLRPLFSRLAAPGCYHLLRQQYRCGRNYASLFMYSSLCANAANCSNATVSLLSKHPCQETGVARP